MRHVHRTMPRRDDLRKILLIGAGPIVIGQACEFDYSGTQGAKALRAEGYEVILVNSNLATALDREGVLSRLGIELLGARPETIAKAEDRALFKAAMEKIGLECPRAGVAHSVEEAWAVVRDTGFPAILRPSFTLGGSGGGIAYSEKEFVEKVSWALAQSPTHEVLIEESVLGWKEYELEVMRDRAD